MDESTDDAASTWGIGQEVKPTPPPDFREAGEQYLEEQYVHYVKILEAKGLLEAKEEFMCLADKLSRDPRCHSWRAYRTLTRKFNDLISYDSTTNQGRDDRPQQHYHNRTHDLGNGIRIPEGMALVPISQVSGGQRRSYIRRG